MKIKTLQLQSLIVIIFVTGCLPAKKAYFPDNPTTYSVKADWPGLPAETKAQLEILTVQGQKNTFSICANGQCLLMNLPKPLPPCNPPGICMTLFEMTYKDPAFVTLTNKTDKSVIQLTIVQKNSAIVKVLNAMQNHTLILQAQ
jgi:hypothetical protein